MGQLREAGRLETERAEEVVVSGAAIPCLASCSAAGSSVVPMSARRTSSLPIAVDWAPGLAASSPGRAVARVAIAAGTGEIAGVEPPPGLEPRDVRIGPADVLRQALDPAQQRPELARPQGRFAPRGPRVGWPGQVRRPPARA